MGGSNGSHRPAQYMSARTRLLLIDAPVFVGLHEEQEHKVCKISQSKHGFLPIVSGAGKSKFPVVTRKHALGSDMFRKLQPSN